MLFGNPERFAFLIERVPEWESITFINGIMYVYLNGKMYPDSLRTTTLNVDLMFLFDSTMPDFQPKVNENFYAMDTAELFKKLCEITFPDDYDTDNDYSYQIPLQETEDSGYDFFAVASENHVRILAGKYSNGDIVFDNEVIIDKLEFTDIKDELFKYYENEIKK